MNKFIEKAVVINRVEKCEEKLFWKEISSFKRLDYG